MRKDFGAEVELVDGDKGELSVLVDGVPMIQKTGDDLPNTEEVEAAVRKAMPVGA